MAGFDLIILSNGPGEITTWVLPVVKEIRASKEICQKKLRISLILSPCPHSTGNEHKIALAWPEIDRVLPAEEFFSFLLWGKTRDNWDWRQKGLVLFLGGDQFFALVIAKRLGYSSLVYAEWEARWYRYIDYFAVMNESVMAKIPPAFRHKCTIVGDLMAETSILNSTLPLSSNRHSIVRIGLLPGSKSSKLTQGVPFLMAIAEYIWKRWGGRIDFIIPMAPTLTPDILAYYAQKRHNPLISQLGNVEGKLVLENSQIYLQTDGGLKIRIITRFPCYEELVECQLCLTTVGANTAQLGALAIPMIVLIPTYQLTAMKSWDGLQGLLANLPIIGDVWARLINWFVIKYTLKNKKLYAWPNIWAKREIVPELIGHLRVEDVGNLVINMLENREKLLEIKSNLQEVRGKAGAARELCQIVVKIIGDKRGFKNF
ncbi:MAG: lipid-A-disaccharide synthase [Geminocystis sp.]|nr:lipid-A-disaccharide synthase [Geminocystis sp.]HIK38718.1 lipid-A-disaccharide synthase [Geminocystis sp. M7585_C2015_104]MCS7148127.1 lipid-A-disaccharide synthase [Geminocystis sp.]MCX8078080.1 lipid-A-disaccharide synthase [Geminocystis sp.]MDW8116478.1 lipid-A-disaccharide synthase [Geminocystis sp.]